MGEKKKEKGDFGPNLFVVCSSEACNFSSGGTTFDVINKIWAQLGTNLYVIFRFQSCGTF